MKVKCTINKIKNNSNLLNFDVEDILIVGQEYVVFRIIIRENTYFLIFDGSHLIEVPCQMFDIIEENISNNWVVHLQSGILTIGAKLFNEEFWFDDFSELSEEERIKKVDNFLI